MADVASITSSPSLYSRRGSHTGHIHASVERRRPATTFNDSDFESDEELPSTTSRISVVSGPTVRKYADLPWGDEQAERVSITGGGGGGGGGGFGRMIRAATRQNSGPGQSKSRHGSPTGSLHQSAHNAADSIARRGLAIFSNKGGNTTIANNNNITSFVPSSSGASLQTISTVSSDDRSHPITPTLKAPFGSPPSPTTADHRSFEFSQGTPRGGLGAPFGSDDQETLLPTGAPKGMFGATNRGGIRKPFKIEPSSIAMNVPSTQNGLPNMDSSVKAGGGAGVSGFGLISLEAAQERERAKSHRRTGTAHKITIEKQSRKSDTGRTGRPSFGSISGPVGDSRSAHLERSNLPPEEGTPGRASFSASTYSPPPPVPIGRTIKVKKSGLMKLFKGEKIQTTNTSGFSILTPPLPSPSVPIQNVPLPAVPHSLARGNSIESKASPITSRKASIDVGNNSVSWPVARSRNQPLPPSGPPSSKSSSPANPSRKYTLGSTLGLDLLQPKLELRPISMNFSQGLPSAYLSDLVGKDSDLDSSSSQSTSSPIKMTEPLTPVEDPEIAALVKEEVARARKDWLVQVFELEAQVRELKDELAEAKEVRQGMCESCGCTCGGVTRQKQNGKEVLRPLNRVMDRARAKTGGARGVFGSGSLYEWE